jgi:hypothetical protein
MMHSIFKIRQQPDVKPNMTSLCAASAFSNESDSEQAGEQVGRDLLAGLGGETAKAVIIYATINHDQTAAVEQITKLFGPGIPIIGCSTPGMVSNENIVEEGFALGGMVLGGDALQAAAAVAKTFQENSLAKGKSMGQSLKASLGKPDLVTLFYDPLCHGDVEQMVAGLHSEVDCPVVGGAAGQPFGPPIRTFQYFGNEVFSQGAVALGLKGPFTVDIGVGNGTVPSGVVMTVTKTDGPCILAIDDAPAIECWSRATGYSTSEILHQNYMAAWAIAIERRRQVESEAGPVEKVSHLIRGAFGIDVKTGSIIMQTAIPEGTKIRIHHRDVDAVLKGTADMGKEISAKLAQRKPWAVLGFECAACTSPFLGIEATVDENRALRAAVAPQTPWLGMMAWGEIAPCLGLPAFHNYTYALAVLTETAS